MTEQLRRLFFPESDKPASPALSAAEHAALPGAATQSGQAGARKVDLVFVIDTTGSMSDKIDGLLQTCAKFVDEFTALQLQQRIAIVAFGDLRVRGDKIVRTDFTSNVEVTKKSLKKIPRYSGGGNKGESSLEAIEKALDLPFDADAVKVLILITDEPAHQKRLQADEMTGRLAEREFLVFVVSPPLDYYKAMAKRNGGKWYKVSAKTDFTDLLQMFREMASRVSQVVLDVHEIGEGSVAKYLRLNPPGAHK
jgi:Mg-chelatase subunit ChlD